MLVSSRKHPKLAMNAILESSSREPYATGFAKTGFALPKRATLGAWSRPDVGFWSQRSAATFVTSFGVGTAFEFQLGANEIPPGFPTLPRRAFKAFTARVLKKPFD